MSKRKKSIEFEQRDFNIDDFIVKTQNLEFVEEFLWTFNDFKDCGVRIRTPRIWVQGDQVPQKLWFLPMGEVDQQREIELVTHAVSGICQGWIGVGSYMAMSFDDDMDETDFVFVFSDPDDLILFKLTIPI